MPIGLRDCNIHYSQGKLYFNGGIQIKYQTIQMTQEKNQTTFIFDIDQKQWTQKNIFSDNQCNIMAGLNPQANNEVVYWGGVGQFQLNRFTSGQVAPVYLVNYQNFSI